MLLRINCDACRGTGGLYDHGLGVDDECVECSGQGFLYFATGTDLEEATVPCEKVPEGLEREVNELRKEIDDNGGTANYILKWEEADCPCCGSRLKFELCGRLVETRCSEEGVCHFEVECW
tara:strand:+ start:162 stop:524 length:363 start_codon:yes stop_codon:yes gene_type:complete